MFWVLVRQQNVYFLLELGVAKCVKGVLFSAMDHMWCCLHIRTPLWNLHRSTLNFSLTCSPVCTRKLDVLSGFSQDSVCVKSVIIIIWSIVIQNEGTWRWSGHTCQWLSDLKQDWLTDLQLATSPDRSGVDLLALWKDTNLEACSLTLCYFSRDMNYCLVWSLVKSQRIAGLTTPHCSPSRWWLITYMTNHHHVHHQISMKLHCAPPKCTELYCCKGIKKWPSFYGWNCIWLAYHNSAQCRSVVHNAGRWCTT